MLPASSTFIPANSVGQVTQEIRIINSAQGEKGIIMKTKLCYKSSGNPVCETFDIINNNNYQ